MKNYKKEIVTRLLDIYERRGYYREDTTETRAVNITIADAFPEYVDAYNHTAYQDINLAIEDLSRKDIIAAQSSSRGAYEKVKLNTNNVEAAYAFAKRKPLSNKYQEITAVLNAYSHSNFTLLQKLVADFHEKVEAGKKIPYGIGYDAIRLNAILDTIDHILHLSSETYIRNFSDAFCDNSKNFQKNYKSTIQSILYDYTETAVEKEKILEVYNLYENPTYVYLKGNAIITGNKSKILLPEFTGGISLAESALKDTTGIEVLGSAVITVENLTTFHDCSDHDSLFIYLGGFHNHSKELLLKKVFAMNPRCKYLHKGDLDVFGFAILENLKKRTGIPFEPLEMDISTLKKLYDAGLYVKLTEADKKTMAAPNLQQYADIFQFMLDHDCKAEQESMMALNLL